MAKEEWTRRFMRYHYLTHELNPASQCYGLFDEENIVGFIAVTHFPHPNNPKIKHCHRLVILPDYQGIGLGTKFLNEIARLYVKQGFDFSITTSARNLMAALGKRKEWSCQRYGKLKLHHGGKLSNSLNKTTSSNRTTATFFYKKEAI